jgi:lipopolysaccharide/colanic/teichoic acid biosynthesis glycosyltransferase
MVEYGMSVLGNRLDQVISFGKQLDASLVGEEYIRSAEKQRWDQFATRLLLPLTVPIVRMARLAVWAEDHGPTIVELKRVGQDEQLFLQRKIRSMTAGVERQPHQLDRKSKDDPRITKVGKYLRALSLDELVQLHNVQEGHMSLVGPRPQPPEEFAQHALLDSAFSAAYTCARPGITGLEQINGRGALGAAERIAYAKQYAEEACRDMDLEILWQTLKVVVTRDGAF